MRQSASRSTLSSTILLFFSTLGRAVFGHSVDSHYKALSSDFSVLTSSYEALGRLVMFLRSVLSLFLLILTINLFVLAVLKAIETIEKARIGMKPAVQQKMDELVQKLRRIRMEIVQQLRRTQMDAPPNTVRPPSLLEQLVDQSTVNTMLPVDSKQEEILQRDEDPQCSICGDPSVICCKPNASTSEQQEERHCLCQDCFNAYARTSFAVGGAFETTQALYDYYDDNRVSMPGELPCPYFSTGKCDCHTLAEEALLPVLLSSKELLKKWKDAMGRLAVEKSDLERAKARRLEAQKARSRTHLQAVECAVQEALSLGRRMECPQCNQRGEKDGACMHITCSHCKCKWCYCCGHPRKGQNNSNNNSERQQQYCQGCDAKSSFMENQQGWGDLAILPDETRGYGALHEFHRRRMIFFLNQIRQVIPNSQWFALQQAYPDLLMNIPTRGRYILWQEIDEATTRDMNILFGNTTKYEQLRWHNDTDMILTGLQRRFSRMMQQEQQQQQQQQQHEQEQHQRRQGRQQEQNKKDSVPRWAGFIAQRKRLLTRRR